MCPKILLREEAGCFGLIFWNLFLRIGFSDPRKACRRSLYAPKTAKASNNTSRRHNVPVFFSAPRVFFLSRGFLAQIKQLHDLQHMVNQHIQEKIEPVRMEIVTRRIPCIQPFLKLLVVILRMDPPVVKL